MYKYVVAFVFAVIIIACGNDTTESTPVVFDEFKYGAKVFQKNCVLCHGIDGKLQFNGAKDITKSTLTLDERILLVTNGRKTMTAFKGILSEKKIKAVAAYTMKMKKE